MAERADERTPLVVVGVDGSETSLRAGAYALGVARRQDARVVALFVHTVSGLAAAAPGAIAAMNQTSRDVAAELRVNVAEQSERWNVQASFVERQGNPFTELVALATDLHADAVIVGASTQAGHRLVGSLAVHLVRAARWPVTVVP